MEAQTPDNVVYPTWGSHKPPSIRKSVLKVFATNPDLANRFSSACQASAPAVRSTVLDVRSALLVRGHKFATHDEQFEEVAEALFDLAGELMPNTPGAVRLQLRERVEARGGQKDSDPVEAIEALAAEDYAAFDYLVLAADRGTDEAVLNAAKHIWQMLCERGRKYPPKGFSQFVRVVLEVFTVERSTELEIAEEPIEGEIVDDGGWDEDRAHEVSRSALHYISSHTRNVDLDAIDRTEPDRAEDEMHAAAEAGDLEAYIVATRRWASAWRRAAEQLGVGE